MLLISSVECIALGAFGFGSHGNGVADGVTELSLLLVAVAVESAVALTSEYVR